jgi:hypothetical protein
MPGELKGQVIRRPTRSLRSQPLGPVPVGEGSAPAGLGAFPVPGLCAGHLPGGLGCRARSISPRSVVTRWDDCPWRCPGPSAQLITCAGPAVRPIPAARPVTCYWGWPPWNAMSPQPGRSGYLPLCCATWSSSLPGWPAAPGWKPILKVRLPSPPCMAPTGHRPCQNSIKHSPACCRTGLAWHRLRRQPETGTSSLLWRRAGPMSRPCSSMLAGSLALGGPESRVVGGSRA